MRQLPGPILQRQRRARKARMVPKRSDAAASIGISQELQVQQGAAAAREAGQHLVPVLLALVAVGELDVDVLEREGLLAQLLEPNDDVVGGRVDPRLLVDEGGAGGLELGVGEDARGAGLGAGALLDVNLIAGCDEGLGGGRGQGGAVLEGLGLGAEVEDCGRHCEVMCSARRGV